MGIDHPDIRSPGAGPREKAVLNGQDQLLTNEQRRLMDQEVQGVGNRALQAVLDGDHPLLHCTVIYGGGHRGHCGEGDELTPGRILKSGCFRIGAWWAQVGHARRHVSLGPCEHIHKHLFGLWCGQHDNLIVPLKDCAVGGQAGLTIGAHQQRDECIIRQRDLFQRLAHNRGIQWDMHAHQLPVRPRKWEHMNEGALRQFLFNVARMISVLLTTTSTPSL